MQKKILLTGATGFLGSHLLGSFITQGFEVSIIKRSSSDTWRIANILKEVKAYDIDKTSLKLIFKDVEPEIIVHTACAYGRNKEEFNDIIKSNLIFGLDLLEESIKNNVKTFINTDSLLPRNINDYSLSKSQFADWLKKRSSQIQTINLKIEHMYGVKDDKKKFIHWLINEMLNSDGLINLTSGIQKRDFVYVTDVINAYNLIIQNREFLSEWDEFDIGTNVFTEVKEFVLALALSLEKEHKKIIVPRLNFGSIPYRMEEIMDPILDNTKLTALGWKYRVGVKEGIKKILKEYK
jgi:CDP-paratose synthetase